MQLKDYWGYNMRKWILALILLCSTLVSFAEDIYQQIYNLDSPYYGKDFPTAKYVSYPRENVSIELSYKETGTAHFAGSEHSLFTEIVLIKVGKTVKTIITEEQPYPMNKNYITLCKMHNGNKLLSHTGVFEGIEFFEPWIGFNIKFYEIMKYTNNPIIKELPENIESKFNKDNEYWAPTVRKNKPNDGRGFYPFYNEAKTLKRLIEMNLCNPIDSPQILEKNLKNKKEINIDELYLDNQFLLYPLDNNNVVSYNNTAFYLEQNKNYNLAVYLLKKIIEKYPSREVAYINLGDAYWESGNKKGAVQSYQNYVQKMYNLGKQEKIPERVLNRIESFPNN